jgi:hypothetical protein
MSIWIFKYEINVDPDLVEKYRKATYEVWGGKKPQFHAYKLSGVGKLKLEDCPVTDTTDQTQNIRGSLFNLS